MAMPEYYPFRSAQARADYWAWYDRRAEAWPVPKDTRMVETAFGATCVHVSGSSALPPLVLLPGLGSNALAWIDLVEPLSAFFCTYAVDSIADYGRSVASRPVMRADLVGWLDGLLSALGLARDVSIMGVSLGAWLSAQYAARDPRRPRRLVWLAPIGTILPLSAASLFRAMLSGMWPAVFLRPFLEYISPDLQRDEAGRALTQEVMTDVLLARRCFGPMPVIAPTVLTGAQLGGLSVPTLCLLGQHERFYSSKKALARLRRIAPQICVEIVPGVGHDMTAVRPETLARRALAFLNEP